MMKAIVIILSHLLGAVASVYAGNGDYFRVAEKSFYNKEYHYAIPFYKSVLNQRPGKKDSVVILRLADCYWNIREYDSASVYYKLYKSKFTKPVYYVWWRIAELAANSRRYLEAAETMEDIKGRFPDRQKKLADERWKGFSNADTFLKDSLSWHMSRLQLNSEQSEYSPQYYKEGLLFLTNRFLKHGFQRAFAWDGMSPAGIFRVTDTTVLKANEQPANNFLSRYRESKNVNDDKTPMTSNDNKEIITRVNTGSVTNDLKKYYASISQNFGTASGLGYGPFCFNKERTRIYFTRYSSKTYHGEHKLEICEASLEKGEWKNVKVMAFVKEANDYFHPAINEDGTRMYFCSNLSGGQGGSDIYSVNISANVLIRLSV
jgi:hypothetical protein